MNFKKAKTMIEKDGLEILGWGNAYKFARVRAPNSTDTHVLDTSSGVERTVQRLQQLKKKIAGT